MCIGTGILLLGLSFPVVVSVNKEVGTCLAGLFGTSPARNPRRDDGDDESGTDDDDEEDDVGNRI